MVRVLEVCAQALLLATGVIACGSGEDAPKPAPAPTCTGPAPTRGLPVDGALEIGEGSSDDFRPYMDGDTTELVVGSQGGYMAVPVFRVDSSALGTDGMCTYLKVIVTLDDGSASRNFDVRLPNASPDAPYWFYTTLPLFLSNDEADVLGKSATYNAAFTDDGKEADAQVSLELVDDR